MQTMKRIWTLNPWIKWVIVAAASGGIGFFASAIVSSISDYNRMLDREVAEVQSGAQQVQDSLALLALVANGEAQPSEEVSVGLTQGLLNLNERAKSLSAILPGTATEYAAYKSAMKDLNISARKITGARSAPPINAREFVESVSEWYIAKDNYEEKIHASRTGVHLISAILFR